MVHGSRKLVLLGKQALKACLNFCLHDSTHAFRACLPNSQTHGTGFLFKVQMKKTAAVPNITCPDAYSWVYTTSIISWQTLSQLLIRANISPDRKFY